MMHKIVDRYNVFIINKNIYINNNHHHQQISALSSRKTSIIALSGARLARFLLIPLEATLKTCSGCVDVAYYAVFALQASKYQGILLNAMTTRAMRSYIFCHFVNHLSMFFSFITCNLTIN